MIKEKIAKLIDVKSIVTIQLLALFAVCSLTMDTIPQEVNNMVMMAVTFYFGAQNGSKSMKTENDRLKAEIEDFKKREVTGIE